MDKIVTQNYLTVEIKSKGIHHTQEIRDELDFEILKAVLDKIRNAAAKIIQQK